MLPLPAATSEDQAGAGLVAALSRLAQAIGDAAIADAGAPVAAALHDGAQACIDADRAAVLEGVHGLPELLRLVAAGLRGRAARDGEPLDAPEAASLLGWAGDALAFAGGDRDEARAHALVAGVRDLPWIPGLTPRLNDYLVRRLAATAGGGVAGASLASAAPAPAESPAETAQAEIGLPGDVAPTAGDADAADGRDAAVAVPASSAPPSEGSPGEALWIAPAELELAAAAVMERLLPQVDALAADDGSDPAHTQAQADDAAWNVRLLANALGMLNLPALSDAIAIAADGLPGAPHADRAALLAATATAALGVFTEPGEPAAALLVETLEDPRWPRPLDAALRTTVLAEAARIRVGTDPALASARQRIAAPADADLRVPDDVAPGVLAGMLRELPDRATALNAVLQSLDRADAGDDAARDIARRLAHTIKGDANTVGVRGLAEVAHALEDVLDELARRREAPSGALAAVLAHAGDVIEAIAEHLVAGAPAPPDVLELLQSLFDAARALYDGEDLPAATAPTMSTEPEPVPPQATGTPATAAPAADAGPSAGATLNVPVALLDELLRLSGEAIVMARQVEQRVQSVATAHRDLLAQRGRARELLSQLDDLVALRGAALQSARMAAGGSVDALELDQYNELHVVSRRLLEADSDEGTQLQSVDRELLSLDDLLAQQERAQAELQQSILRSRTLPFRSIGPRLQRAARQAARTVLKEVEVVIEGGATPVDSEVLERLAEPLLHAVRNAVDHGIEAADTRAARGKPAAGHIRVAAARDGNRVYITVADDGGGLDLAAIRARGEALGLLQPGTDLPPESLARLILRPGFSTRSQVTQVSGRGIGMDVVNQRIGELRGTLRIDTEAARGTTLRIELPASMNAAHAAIARVGDGWAAFATAGVRRFVPVLDGDLQRDDEGARLRVDGRELPARWAESLFDLAAPRRDVAPRVAALVDDEGVESAILLREVEGMREVIIRGLGPWVPALPGVRGATILGSGAVAPVVDLAPLLRGAGRGAAVVAGPEPEPAPEVLVVDDSLSVRRALQQLLEDSGFRVRVARDGLEALDALRVRAPALLLVDLEMPRMNGLDLTGYLRSQDATRELPVVMVTSRTAETHRRLAIDAGVDEMMTKPFSDEALLNAVLRLLERGRGAGALHGAS
jgi:chemotaxis protein histidine kinase CheA